MRAMLPTGELCEVPPRDHLEALPRYLFNLARLTNCQRVILAATEAGMTIPEIAEGTNRSVRTVQRQKTLALASLAQAINQAEPAEILSPLKISANYGPATR